MGEIEIGRSGMELWAFLIVDNPSSDSLHVNARERVGGRHKRRGVYFQQSADAGSG